MLPFPYRLLPPPLPPSPTLYYRCDHAISKSSIAAGAVVVLEVGREVKKGYAAVCGEGK